jgi:hypothetical protein
MADPCTPTLTPLLTFVGGFFTAIVAEPLRRWILRPALVLEFGNTAHYVTPTPEQGPGGEHQAIFFRVKVTNRKPALAKGCRVFLTNIEQQDSTGSFVTSTDYCESLQLGWAVRNEPFEAVDVPRGVPFFVDVISTRSIDRIFRPQIPLFALRYVQLFQTPGTYRLTIVASGDDVKPATLRLVVKWTGEWNRAEVSRVGAV